MGTTCPRNWNLRELPSGEIQVCTLAFVYSSARTNKRASKYGINKDVSLLGHIEWAMQWDLRPKKKKREVTPCLVYFWGNLNKP